MNWQKEAERAAEYVCKCMSEAHRGVFTWHGPTQTVLLFGNDGYPAQHLEYLTDYCAEWNIPVRASATFEDYSFAMLIEVEERIAEIVSVDCLTEMLWDSWYEVTGYPLQEAFQASQTQASKDCIDRHFLGLEHPWEAADC